MLILIRLSSWVTNTSQHALKVFLIRFWASTCDQEFFLPIIIITTIIIIVIAIIIIIVILIIIIIIFIIILISIIIHKNIN